MKDKKTIFCLVILFFIIFPIYFQPFTINSTYFSSIQKKNEDIQLSKEITGTRQWLNNSNFDTQQFWISSESGDKNDVDASISEGQANFIIVGEKRTFNNISGIPINNTYQKWIAAKESPISVLPDNMGLDQYGFWADNEYDENVDQSRNNPIIHWKRNITMPVNMDDYIITSADLSAIFNATADINLETPTDTLLDSGYAAEYDHARFFVLISDLNRIESYELAYNQTVNLGMGTWGRTGRGGQDNITKEYMTPIDEEDIIFFLDRVLGHDNRNFTFTLGIDIYCEDNYPGLEIDTWYSLRIKSCNFSFNYEKIIDKFTSISWNQDCDKISDLSPYTVLVDNALLNFNYKIDQDWPTNSSPNSELCMIVNNNKLPEVIKLDSTNTSYQPAKLGGFDVTNLITDDVNVSFEVYIADDFKWDDNITISIDNASLIISYIIIEPESIVKKPDYSWIIYTLGIGIIGLITVFTLYQTHFKYPPLVRKIKKLRKKMRKGKKTKTRILKTRDDIIIKNYHDSKQILKLEPIKEEGIIKNEITKNSTGEVQQ
ncbi:MAG: hypothetical protein ACFFAQ_12315 [Promethearchaeota archaeon]